MGETVSSGRMRVILVTSAFEQISLLSTTISRGNIGGRNSPKYPTTPPPPILASLHHQILHSDISRLLRTKESALRICLFYTVHHTTHTHTTQKPFHVAHCHINLRKQTAQHIITKVVLDSRRQRHLTIEPNSGVQHSTEQNSITSTHLERALAWPLSSSEPRP